MRTLLPWSAVLLLLALCACGSSPVPVDALATAQASTRAAQEVGATSNAKASLHLKLAQEQLEEAKRLIADGSNDKALPLLQRASADAELAVALARQATMEAKNKQVQEELAASKKGTH